MTHPAPRLFAAVLWCGLALPAAAQQQEAQWRVTSQTSASVVPLYQNQPSPFPQKVVQMVSETGPSPEDLALEAQRVATITRARNTIESPAALEPELGGMVFRGAIQGPRGWAALWQNRWLRAGDTLNTRVKASALARNTLSELATLDPAEAEYLNGILAQRLAQASTTVVIGTITSSSVNLRSPQGTWKVPVRQSAD